MLKKVVSSSALAIVLACTSAYAIDRTAEQVLADINQIKQPQFDQAKREDEAYVKEYREKSHQVASKRAELAKELWDVDANNAKALSLMQFRWQFLASDGKAEVAKAEMEQAMAKLPEKKAELSFAKAQFEMMTAGDSKAGLAAAESFIAANPTDPRGGDLLSMAAGELDDDAAALKIYQRVLKDYPKARSASQAKGKIRQAEAVGKPFELSFTDAISGKQMSMGDLQGKVVVVDFWATWCGPCVAEMPHMKEIYAKYKDKGVQFVGISLDHPEDKGGLAKLKDFVAKNEIGWPQYYQGKGWESEFSSSWGINSIPALFVVDQKGNLYSINARGKVEQLIEKLLNGTEKVGG